MDSSIQSNNMIVKTQHTNGTNTQILKNNTDTDNLKTVNNSTNLHLVQNKVFVKDVKTSNIEPKVLSFDSNDFSKQKVNISNNAERKHLLMSEVKKLYENYKGLFGRVIKDDKEISELFDILKLSLNNNQLPSSDSLKKLSSAIEKFKTSDKFVNDFYDKEKRKGFISSFESIIKNIEGFNKNEAPEQKFVETSNKVSSNLDKLINAINNSSEKGPLTDSLKDIMIKYKEALASGDNQLIALYSSLIDKITTEVSNGATGAQIADTMKNYNNLVVRMYDKSIDSKLVDSELKTFLGEDLYKVFLSDLTDNSKPSVSNNKTNENSESENSSNNTEREASSNNAIDLIRAQAETTPNKPRPMVFNEDNIRKIEVMTAQEVKKVIESIPDLKEGLEDLQKNNKELIYAQINLFNFKNDIKISNLNSQSLISNSIKERLEEIMKKIEEMESNLDLSVEISDINIITLLEKFRDIIKRLDTDTRDNTKKSIESTLIDLKNQSYLKDMELRWKSIDKIREEINNIFKQISEKAS